MPKNTTERKCGGHETPDYNGERDYYPDCKTCPITTENGWEEKFKVFDEWFALLVESENLIGIPADANGTHKRIKTLIQQIAKEEYEKGYQRREDELVIVLDEVAREHPEWTLDYFATLFTAMNKQHHEAALETPNKEPV